MTLADLADLDTLDVKPLQWTDLMNSTPGKRPVDQLVDLSSRRSSQSRGRRHHPRRRTAVVVSRRTDYPHGDLGDQMGIHHRRLEVSGLASVAVG